MGVNFEIYDNKEILNRNLAIFQQINSKYQIWDKHANFDIATRCEGTDALRGEHRYYIVRYFFTYQKTFCSVRETV
jgi:hypothetical protein